MSRDKGTAPLMRPLVKTDHTSLVAFMRDLRKHDAPMYQAVMCFVRATVKRSKKGRS